MFSEQHVRYGENRQTYFVDFNSLKLTVRQSKIKNKLAFLTECPTIYNKMTFRTIKTDITLCFLVMIISQYEIIVIIKQ